MGERGFSQQMRAGWFHSSRLLQQLFLPIAEATRPLRFNNFCARHNLAQQIRLT
jgi:hypothetical protein